MSLTYTGSVVTTYDEIKATPSPTGSTVSAFSVSSSDYIGLTVNAITGSCEDLTFTIFIDYTI